MDNNNYVCLQGWMVKELGLRNSELIIYSLIYGFSQAEGTYFTGSLSYIAEWTGTTKRSVIDQLKRLQDRGLIEKEESFINNVKFCKYRYCKKALTFLTSSEESSRVVKKLHYPGEKTSPNNIVDNIEEKKVINSSKDSLITKESDEMKWIIPMVQPKSTTRLKTSQTYSSVFTEETRQTLTTQEEDSIEEAVSGYVEMRKVIKKPATAKALRLAISKAWSLSSHSVSKFIEIIDQSTMNSWQGVFPIREQGNARAGNLPDYSDDDAISKEGFKTV